MPMPLVPIILSGGAGTRLWPLSRETAPKPFLVLPDGETLLGKTAARARRAARRRRSSSSSPTGIIIFTPRTSSRPRSTTRRRASPICSSLSVATPAPAIALGALYAESQHGADAILLVLPSDHLIRDGGAFTAAVDRAKTLARGGLDRHFRHRPDASRNRVRLHRMRRARSDRADALRAARFIEKPPLAEARGVPHRRQLRLELGDVLLHARDDTRGIRARMRRRCYEAATTVWQELARRRRRIDARDRCRAFCRRARTFRSTTR